jgi:hypothetical protein
MPIVSAIEEFVSRKAKKCHEIHSSMVQRQRLETSATPESMCLLIESEETMNFIG